MKWLIVEDALRDRTGHWLEYVATFVRELTALGDEVVVLCDRKAEGFILEQTGALPVLPESIWHRMGDGAGALRRYARVPGHAVATFVAMRRFFRGFDHRGHRDHRGVEEEGSHGGTANTEMAAGLRPGAWASASESDSRTSKLVDSLVSESLIRSADGPAAEAALLLSTKDGLLRTDGSKHVPCSATETEPKERATRYALPATASPPDWIFVPTVLVHHLLGWWLLLRAGAVPKKSRVLLFFPNLPIRLDDSGWPHWFGGPTTRLMAWLFGRLRREVESGRVVVGVETHAMRRALEGVIGLRVVYLPHPVEARAEARRRGGKDARESLTTVDTESTIEHWGKCEMEQPKVGPKGEEAGATESKAEPARRLGSQAGDKFSNPSSSELVRNSENPSPNRFASIPAFSPATSYPLPATTAKPLVFGCYGAARWEKGSDVFQEAIKLILSNEVASKKWRVASLEDEPQLDTHDPLPVTAAGRSLRFAIQWVEDFQDADGNWVSIDPWLREHPQVEVIGRYFQGDEYERRLAETDVMVLPYRSPYRLRVSRVVIEAMIHRMPVVTTKRTTLYEQADEHGVVMGCEEGSAESLARAILEFAEVFAAMREAAEKKAEKAAESFSVGYFRKLLQKK